MKNLFAKALFAVALTIAAAMQTTAQESFAYQAVIRDGEGNLITNSEVELKFSLLNDGKTQYAETQKAKANQYGNISVMIGTGEKTEGDFAKVAWNTLDITLKVEVKLAGSDKFIELGQTKINPVPYAMYAAQGGGAATVNGAAKGAETLFEVNDREGRPVFAVTNDGIVVYVDDQDGKMKRSGFLVTGREASKGEPAKEYFSVTTDGTQIFVDENGSDKLRRSGFLVTGREATKGGTTDNYLSVDGNGTTVYVDVQDDKMKRSGFLVTGREASKDEGFDIFKIDGSTTTVYVDDNNGGKMRRSGFLVTGREAAKGDKSIVDITGSRTNLTTSTLSIANSGVVETDAPVSAFQISEENITMNSDMAMGGGVRPALDVEEIEEVEEYKVWLSDTETDDELDDYDEINSSGYFYFDNGSGYNWLGAFYDDLVVPLSSEYSMLMFNRDGEETAIAEDAVVVVFYEYGYINVWPLAALDDFTVSFAMTDYYPTSAFSGTADEYARFNVTLNSTEPYAGCWVYLDGEIPYTAKITMPDRTFEQDVIKNEYGYSDAGFEVVFGQKVTMEATDIPTDKLFNYWFVSGRRYYSNPVTLPVMSRNTRVVAVFKDESEKLWVDGTFTSSAEPTAPIGSEENPYITIAAALDSVARNEDPRVGYRIIAQNIRDSIAIKADCNGKAKYISIDIDDSHIYQIKDSTTVPVYVRNMDLQPHNSYGGDVVQVKIKDASLTLEGCVIDGNGDLPGKMHGAYVSAGNLTLINTAVSNFTAEQGGGVYVASGATFTVKGNTNDMKISGNTAELGGGIYVANGATLNVSGGQISDNKFVDEAANLAGADIYLAGDKAVFNLNPNYQGSDIGKIGLAGGAVVTAVGNYPIYERYHGEPEETQCVASFDYIENIEKPLVKLGTNVQPNDLSKISKCFRVVARDLLAEGYSNYLNSEAKLFKFNRVYATGQMRIEWASGSINTNVDYTYFRNEENNEYLYLKYMGNDTCEYRNYWIVDGTIYGDTIYLKISETEDAQPIYNYQSAFENENRWKENWGEIFISEKYENDINLFGIQQIVDGYDVGYDYGMTIFTNDGNVMAAMKDNVVVGSTMDFFKNDGNLAVFKSLIAPSVSIEGRGVDLKNITGLDWFGSGYTLVDSEATPEGIVEMENDRFEDNTFLTEKDIFEYRGEPRKQTLAEVEAMFYDLKHGFTVTLATSLGGKIINNNTEYTGAGNTFKKDYGDVIQLLAIPDEGFVFSGWSDGLTDPARTVGIGGHQNLTAKFSKEFYVSSDGSDETGNGSQGSPYKSFSKVVGTISDINTKYNYVINVLSSLDEAQTIEGDFTANEITINGSKDVKISGGNASTTLTINTTVPVIISDITIKDGWAADKGGGIYCAPGSNVTLNAAVKVTGNRASNYGGGVYVDGTILENDTIRGKLTMNEGSVISSNVIIDNQVYGWNGGMGVYVNCGELIMNGGEISNNNGTQVDQRGALRLENAIFKMRGGKITNNTVSHIGANIFSGEKTLIEMSGGEISNGSVGCYAGASGAIYLSSNTVMNMSGGVIKDNTASAEGKTNASGIMLCSGATLNMSGGTISGNKVLSGTSEGDAIHVGGTFNISDSAYIAADNDVFLAAGKTITVTGSLTHEAPVATITPASYSEEVKVLDGDFADSQGGKFNVTKDGDKQWFIHRGYLTDKYVYDADNIIGSITITDASKPYIICGSEKYTGQIDILADGSNVPYDITLSNINIQHYESWDWSSALILYNKIDDNEADFKITLDGNNILYGRNHSGFKLDGGDDDRGGGRDYVIGAKSNVIFDVKPGTAATLEFKNNYAGTPCLQVSNGLEATFSLAEGCEFVGKISKAEIYSDRINKIDRENDDLFNIYDSNTYSSSQEAFNAFINDARVKEGQVVVGQYLFIIKIERKN